VRDATHEEVRELAPELALGTASGEERARALVHIASCLECRSYVDELSRDADALLALAPQNEPPIGFETRAVKRVRGIRPRQRMRLAATVASIVLVAVGVTAAILESSVARDRNLADRYLALLEGRSHGELFGTTLLTADGAKAGQVFAYEGSSNWIFIVVNADSGRGMHDIVLTPRALPVGSTVGSVRIVDGRASWGSTTGLDLRGLHVQLVDGDGKAEFQAVLPLR